ncbi:hypothetical protein SpCBS45565_g05042 [Spizellomyces sp. 'palustris']|nr:hypothetical protein SpCBS45565_g05042 [Spizellomyces sp. 'palustris']
MALSFARIWNFQCTDIVEDLFARSRDAELHRHEEYAAAVAIQKVWSGYVVRRRLQKLNKNATTIQRYWRGHLGRNFLERLIIERNRRKRMMHYYAMAVRIQKTWRGYHSRKYKFHYYQRKAYIENVKEKINTIREQLAAHCIAQRQADWVHRQATAAALLDRLAGNRHHLVGTQHVPGVYADARGKKARLGMAVVGHASQEDVEGGKTADSEEYNMEDEAQAPEQENESLTCHGRQSSTFRSSQARRHQLLPPLYIPEENLKDNDALRKWLREHVGLQRFKGKSPRRLVEEEHGESDSKQPQGPFLPRQKMERILRKPLQPSLRVETDFYDTSNAQKQERRRREGLKVSDKVFTVVQRVEHPHPDYFHDGDPYSMVSYGGKRGFRGHADKTHHGREFRNIVRPVALFDELANDI